MSNVYNLRDFLSRSTDRPFEETTLHEVLSALPPVGKDGPWIAGGALRRTLLRQEPESDFDLFFRDADQLREFADALSALGLSKMKETEHHMHYRGALGQSALLRDVQLIRFAFYDSAEAVIDSFDFTVCQIAFDGETLTVGDHTLWDLGRSRLAIHRVTYPVSTTRRLLKYTRQGFTACSGCLATLLRETANHPELSLEVAYVD